jgi:phosphocarrier protein
MSHEPPEHRRQVEITNDFGLHLGPAAKFVKLAGRFQSEIRVSHNGKEINGKSILDLTLLAAECGTLLELVARGSDAREAVDALAQLVIDQFREGESDGVGEGDGPVKEPAP